MNLDNYKKYAPMFVRYGVGIVFFLFGISQLFYPEAWFAWLPDWTSAFAEPGTFIFLNGCFDLIIGALLLSGFLTRLAAFLGALHLFGIIANLGFSDIAIRDFGLLLGCISILLNGEDDWCLSRKFKKAQ